MNTQNPQEAFFTWLGQSLGRAIEALRAPDRDGKYLACAVDHADLERRFRAIQHRSPLSALTQYHS
jgi:hypothetical protein